MRKIVLTGGGSAGHVTPNLALIPKLKASWQIEYIGTHQGIERDLIGDRVPYHSISAGKLRRYFDLKNFVDPLRVIKGIIDAFIILRKVKPNIVFSKGGFVSLPVAVAAKFLRIPVVLHESDVTPGLANKLALPFATHICLTFPETINHVSKNKASYTGNPVREKLLFGDKHKALKLCGFTGTKPVILVIGGSLGAVKINQVIHSGLPNLLENYNIIHICGKGNLKPDVKYGGYHQVEYVYEQLPDLFALADMVISRAGANTLFELLALRKPHILIPLSQSASRGDQVLNAHSFQNQGFSISISEEELSVDTLLTQIDLLAKNKDKYIKTMEQSKVKDAVGEIIKVIEATVGKTNQKCFD